jgi:hypothetical protein
MYSYDWIVLVTLGLDRWTQTRPSRHHRQATHEIEFEAAQQRHRDRLKAVKSTKALPHHDKRDAGSLFAVFRYFGFNDLGRPNPVADLPKPQASLASGGDTCSSDRAAS